MESRKKKRSRESNFIVQGSILAIAGIIVRLIGILYRVPMTNIVGDEGMGYYTTAFNVYNIMLILSSYSLPLAVSKMVAGRIAKGQYRNSVKVLKAAIFYATVVGGIACTVTWVFADYFASQLFCLPYAAYALKALAPTIWIMAYLGVFRGYFQGHGTMIPTAVSQIFEQIINAIISVTAASALFQLGLEANLVHNATSYPYAYGAAGGTIGTGAGALTAMVFMLLLFLLYRRNLKRQLRRDKTGRVDNYGDITKTFIFTVIPVILSTTIYNVNSVIDNSILAHGMNYLGQGEEYLALWGIYSNKYLLLVHVPLALANSLSSSLIPTLSRAVATKSRREIISKVSMAIRFSMVIALPAAVGLTILAAPINNLLFHNGSNDEAVRMTVVGSAAVIFYSLSTVTNAILQGINHMSTPIKNAVISLVLHVIALCVMMFGFKMGIYSVLFANMLFALFMCILNGFSIKRYLHYHQELKKTFLLPSLASLIMGAVTFAVYKGFYLLTHRNIVGTVFAIVAAVAVYGVLLIKLGCVEEEELANMPGGRKLQTIAYKLHLM